MEIISITNDKGGVGKTTTAVNLAVGLGKSHKLNRRVLVIDMDGQYDASKMLGWSLDNERQGAPTLFNSLSQDTGLTVYKSSYHNVWLCPASPQLNDVEGHLRSRDVAVLALREALEKPVLYSDGQQGSCSDFDYIFIDCPPAMNLLTKNALAAADSILIPVQLEALSIESLGGVLEQWVRIKKTVNPRLEVKGIVRCMAQNNLKLSKGLNEELQRSVGQYMCSAIIPRSTIVPTSQVEHNVTIDSDPYSAPSLAYERLINELFK